MKRPVPYNGNEPYIFVSYSHKDDDAVWAVIDRMINDGYRVWYDDGIKPGSEWSDFIAGKIKNSGFFLAFMSDNYLASQCCRDEMNYARDNVENHLLVYLQPKIKMSDGMEMRFNQIHAIIKPNYDEQTFFKKLYESENIEKFKGNVPTETQPEDIPATSSEPEAETGFNRRDVNQDYEIVKSYEESRKKRSGIWKAVLAFLLILVAFLGVWFLLFAPRTAPFICVHKLSEPNCTSKVKCLRCGKVFDEYGEHDWLEATCTEPEECANCGETRGSANGHQFLSATCVDPEICSVCGATDGNALGHQWTQASITSLRHCSVCGENARYSVILADYTWDEAVSICFSLGGHLVTINDSSEYDLVLEAIRESGVNASNFYVGARYNATTDEYEWVTDNSNTVVDGSLWSPNEPTYSWPLIDGTVIDEHWVCISYSGSEYGLNDVANDLIAFNNALSGRVAFICEVE